MKGIKLLVGILAAAGLLFSVNANAQENANRDENGKVVRGAYETNKAFDNTFIALGAGINSFIPNLAKPAGWGNIGFALDFNVGKWWTPAVGLRLGFHGLADASKLDFTNPAVPAGKTIGLFYFHGDVLWNISNTIGGYKETRFWDFIPYMSAGVLILSDGITFKNGNVEHAAGFGLLNNLRLGKRVDLNIDLGALVCKGSAYYENAARFLLLPNATIGISVNLFKTGFERHSSITPVVIPVPFTTEQYNDLADKVAALEKENAELKDKIAALEQEVAPLRQLVDGQTYLYENGQFTAVDVKPGSPITLYFDCGSAQLSAREKAHLEYFTSNVVDGDTKLLVNGYADNKTGSARRNQQLSEQRVKTVVDLLVKAGAKEENIESAAHGAAIQLFDGSAKNRVVTIEIQ